MASLSLPGFIFQQPIRLISAVNHLMAWVRRNPDLVNGLHKLGYRKSAKFFTPKEVALIIDYLGEP